MHPSTSTRIIASNSPRLRSGLSGKEIGPVKSSPALPLRLCGNTKKCPKPVIPVKAGIQKSLKRLDDLSRFACTERQNLNCDTVSLQRRGHSNSLFEKEETIQTSPSAKGGLRRIFLLFGRRLFAIGFSLLLFTQTLRHSDTSFTFFVLPDPERTSAAAARRPQRHPAGCRASPC